jgi:hypothetical protein
MGPHSPIRHGHASPTEKSHRAPRLQPGRIYHVFLNVRRENAADPTSGYEAEFCLKPGAAPQQVVVHQVQWDKNLRRKLYEGCNAGK